MVASPTSIPIPGRYRPHQKRAPPPPPLSSVKRPPGRGVVDVVWFKHTDLRVHDHAGLAAAARGGRPTLPLFIFDPFWSRRTGIEAARRLSRVSLLH